MVPRCAVDAGERPSSRAQRWGPGCTHALYHIEKGEVVPFQGEKKQKELETTRVACGGCHQRPQYVFLLAEHMFPFLMLP